MNKKILKSMIRKKKLILMKLTFKQRLIKKIFMITKEIKKKKKKKKILNRIRIRKRKRRKRKSILINNKY